MCNINNPNVFPVFSDSFTSNYDFHFCIVFLVSASLEHRFRALSLESAEPYLWDRPNCKTPFCDLS